MQKNPRDARKRMIPAKQLLPHVAKHPIDEQEEQRLDFLLNLEKICNFNNGNFRGMCSVNYIKCCEMFLNITDHMFPSICFNSDIDFEKLFEKVKSCHIRNITKYFKELAIYLSYVECLITRAHTQHNENLILMKINHGMVCKKCANDCKKNTETCIVGKFSRSSGDVYTMTQCGRKVQISSKSNQMYCTSLYANSPKYCMKYIE